MDELKKRSEVVGTPEGDSEFPLERPLNPSAVESDVDGLQKWPSNSEMEYDKDREDGEGGDKPRGIRRVVDEVSTGKIQP